MRPVGKTALLGHLAEAADGCRIARAAGVESEMELPFADLQALCAPMPDRVGRLPGLQRDALNTAFGLSAGPPPDRFLVGLAVLSLLADAAETQPLMCIVDGWIGCPDRRCRSWRAGCWRSESGQEHALDGCPSSWSRAWPQTTTLEPSEELFAVTGGGRASSPSPRSPHRLVLHDDKRRERA